MHKELWEQLGGLDRRETSQRAKCEYSDSSECYFVTLLNRKYVVNMAEKAVFEADGGSEGEGAGFCEQLCILAYLINSRRIQLAEKLVQAKSLAGGEFFFRGPHALPVDKLVRAFGSDPGLIYAAGQPFGAKKRDFGDASVEVPVLPTVPLTFVIWAGDDEFDARGSILFDRTACEQLPLDALMAAVNLAVGAVVKAVETSS